MRYSIAIGIFTIASVGLLTVYPGNDHDCIVVKGEYRQDLLQTIRTKPLRSLLVAAVCLYIPISFAVLVKQRRQILDYKELIDIKIKALENFYETLKPFFPQLHELQTKEKRF